MVRRWLVAAGCGVSQCATLSGCRPILKMSGYQSRPEVPGKNFVGTNQLSAIDGISSPSPSVTAGAVEHLAVIGKMARRGTINRAAVVEPIAAGRRWSAAHDQLTRMSPSINAFARVFASPIQATPFSLQRADASFELDLDCGDDYMDVHSDPEQHRVPRATLAHC